MGGVCERPGCSRSAAAAVAADPRRQIVWIGDLETSIESVNVLCAPHADNLAAPVGWERRDLRDAPRLFAVPSPSTQAAPAKPRRRSARNGSPTMTGAPAVPQRLDVGLPLDPPAADPVAAPAASSRPAPGLNPALQELHRANSQLSAATSALLSAGGETPMLARAFRTSRAVG